MPPNEHISISGDPGYTLHNLASKKINEFLHNFENDHMKWLEEILIVAKESFSRNNEPELLPKTPSVKNKRRRLRGRRSVQQDTEENTEPPSKRRKSKSCRRSSVRRSVLPAVIEDELFEQQDKNKAKKKSGGRKKKAGDVKWGPEVSLEENTSGNTEQSVPTVDNRIGEGEIKEQNKETVVETVASPEKRKRPTRGASKAANIRVKAQINQINTPPKMTRVTRTASRTGMQRSRLGSTRSTRNTTKSSTDDNSVNVKNDCEADGKVDPEIKSKWTPKVELRQVIQSHKVKQLIHKHEELIVASSSEDELSSPKRFRLSNVNRTLIESTDSQTQEHNQASKFFPLIPSAEDQISKVEQKEEVVNSSSKVIKVSDSDENMSSADSVNGNTSPEKSKTSPSEGEVCIASSQDEVIASSQEEESAGVSSQDEVSDKLVPKSGTSSESNDGSNSVEASQQDSRENEEDKYEDSLEENAVNDMEDDSLMVKPPKRQRSNNTMDEDTVKSVSSKSDECDEDGEPKRRPNRAIRTKQRKGKKLSKRSSVASRRSTRSKRSSIKPRRSKISAVNEEKPVSKTDNAHEADDESSPKRTSRQSDPEKVEVAVCQSNDTMELFEDSLEPAAQTKEQEVQEDSAPSDVAMETEETPPAPHQTPSEGESTEHQTEDVQGDDEATPPKHRKLDSGYEDKPANFKTPVKHAGFGSSNSDYHTSGSSNVESTPSPTSTGGTRLRHKPVPSFLNALQNKRKDSGNYAANANGVITSFIMRNTPIKSKSIKERQLEIKQHIEKKEKKDEEVRRKREIERKERLEEQRRKREERVKRAAEAREKRQQQRREKVQQLEEKYEQKQALTEKAKEEKKKEDLMKKKLFNKKKAEAEARRKQEEEVRLMKLIEQEEEQKRHMEMLLRKKEFEEQERARKLEEARKKQEERLAELEREREREIQLKKEQELEKERERIRQKEERERQKEEERRRKEEEKRRLQLEKERKAREEEEERLRQQKEKEDKEKEKEQKECERLKANILAHNTSQKKLNTTITMESETYEITPQRIHKPATEDDYGISDLHSDDSTDDEDMPRKKIPRWAKGAPLMAQLLNQEQNPPNFDELFDIVDPPDLSVMFKQKRSRFFKRTSSAVWDSPMLK
ncbi:uncharacterized protein LOC144439432 [Glandiceps talaboti]